MSAPLKSTYLEAPGSFSSDRIIAVIYAETHADWHHSVNHSEPLVSPAAQMNSRAAGGRSK